jgi:DNA-binding transcriptional ArsR family regulator
MARAAKPEAFEDAVFAALAHPTRRQILLVLQFRGGAMNSLQIAERFACRWPTVTRHLRVLEQAGLLEVKRRGRGRIYKLRRVFLIQELDRWERWFRGRGRRGAGRLSRGEAVLRSRK